MDSIADRCSDFMDDLELPGRLSCARCYSVSIKSKLVDLTHICSILLYVSDI